MTDCVPSITTLTVEQQAGSAVVVVLVVDVDVLVVDVVGGAVVVS